MTDSSSFSNSYLIKAEKEQASSISNLINLAYRGQRGWTTESEFVKGERITPARIEELMEKKNSLFLINIADDALIATVHLSFQDTTTQIGLFAVHPDYQASGLGKTILNEAEKYAKTNLQANNFRMLVVSQREELIAYYERRGYRLLENVLPYPVHENVGTPKRNDLSLGVMVKP